MHPTTLLLFDIDGTLLTSGGAGETALRLAVREHLGIEDDLRDIEIAGRTDTGIARQIFRKHGQPETADALAAFLDAYLQRLPEVLPQRPGGRLLPGIPALLEALRARPECVLALLTGNLRRGAEIKLRHYGVWDFFAFGAFADDSHDRNALGPFARQRAAEATGVNFPPERIFVLGDTPHDLACARAIGARAVAVATGSHSRAALAEHAPDLLFDDLGDAPAVLAALGCK